MMNVLSLVPSSLGIQVYTSESVMAQDYEFITKHKDTLEYKSTKEKNIPKYHMIIDRKQMNITFLVILFIKNLYS